MAPTFVVTAAMRCVQRSEVRQNINFEWAVHVDITSTGHVPLAPALYFSRTCSNLHHWVYGDTAVFYVGLITAVDVHTIDLKCIGGRNSIVWCIGSCHSIVWCIGSYHFCWRCVGCYTVCWCVGNRRTPLTKVFLFLCYFTVLLC